MLPIDTYTVAVGIRYDCVARQNGGTLVAEDLRRWSEHRIGESKLDLQLEDEWTSAGQMIDSGI